MDVSSKRATISADLWTDAAFLSLSPASRYAWLYLLTCGKTVECGAHGLAMALGWDGEDHESAKLASARSAFAVFRDAKWISLDGALSITVVAGPGFVSRKRVLKRAVAAGTVGKNPPDGKSARFREVWTKLAKVVFFVPGLGELNGLDAMGDRAETAVDILSGEKFASVPVSLIQTLGDWSRLNKTSARTNVDLFLAKCFDKHLRDAERKGGVGATAHAPVSTPAYLRPQSGDRD